VRVAASHSNTYPAAIHRTWRDAGVGPVSLTRAVLALAAGFNTLQGLGESDMTNDDAKQLGLEKMRPRRAFLMAHAALRDDLLTPRSDRHPPSAQPPAVPISIADARDTDVSSGLQSPRERARMHRLPRRGTVTGWKNGFGFISNPSGGKDIMCMSWGLPDGVSSLLYGTEVEFETNINPRARHGYVAVNVTVVKNSTRARGRSQESQDFQRAHGTCVQWREGKGYGFIQPVDGGKPLVCKKSGLPYGTLINEGDKVTFVKVPDRGARDGVSAQQVHIVSSADAEAIIDRPDDGGADAFLPTGTNVNVHAGIAATHQIEPGRCEYAFGTGSMQSKPAPSQKHPKRDSVDLTMGDSDDESIAVPMQPVKKQRLASPRLNQLYAEAQSTLEDAKAAALADVCISNNPASSVIHPERDPRRAMQKNKNLLASEKPDGKPCVLLRVVGKLSRDVGWLVYEDVGGSDWRADGFGFEMPSSMDINLGANHLRELRGRFGALCQQLPFKTIEPSGETSERRWARFVQRALAGGDKVAVVKAESAVLYLTTKKVYYFPSAGGDDVGAPHRVAHQS
jgi:cold shock CspA family protein